MTDKFEQYKASGMEKFGDKFDYSHYVYVTRKDKSTVVCPIHGDFQTTIYEHQRSKYGCSDCAKMLNPTHFNAENFIASIPEDVRALFDFSSFAPSNIDDVATIILKSTDESISSTPVELVSTAIPLALSKEKSANVEPERHRGEATDQKFEIIEHPKVEAAEKPSYIEVAIEGRVFKISLKPLVKLIKKTYRFTKHKYNEFKDR